MKSILTALLLAAFAVVACALLAAGPEDHAPFEVPNPPRWSAVAIEPGMLLMTDETVFQPDNVKGESKVITKREPIVTKTADGWEITFKPIAPGITTIPRISTTSQMIAAVGEMPAGARPGDHWVNAAGDHCRVAADGVNIETDAGNGTVISTALFVQTSNTPKF